MRLLCGGILGYLAIACIVTLASTPCKSETSANATTSEEDEAEFVPFHREYVGVFDWMLFKTMSKRHSGNILLSPISLRIALVLLLEGAQGQTAQQLATVMQLPSSLSANRDQFSSILQSLQVPSPAYNLNLGTRIYIDSNIRLSQRYRSIVKSFYSTDVITANLTDAHPVIGEINGWVSNITAGNIDKLIEDENSVKNSLMLILNALFFKGTWNRKYFSPENTRMGEFYTSKNRTVNVPFMRAMSRFYYSESSELDAKILRIPYSGQKFAMYLVLPRTLDGIERLSKEINPFLLMRHVWLMHDVPVDVSLPKFKFEFSSHLESVLRELGIRDIFDDTAMLTGVYRAKRDSKHLKVSDIVQKAGIEVNENGTAAYVATEVILGNKIEDESFQVNRPFIFYIEDENTGAIIYIGKIMNPLDTAGSAEDTMQQVPSSTVGPQVSNTASTLQTSPYVDERNNLFSMYFLQALNKAHWNENLVSSPASIKTALTMVMEGAVGNTKAELINVLRLPKDESRTRDVTLRTLKSLKRNENGTEIHLATCFWVDQNLSVLDSYREALQSYYGGEIENVNFAESEKAARVINDWVVRQTRNEISSPLVSDIPTGDTRSILTSVIYFKGRWLKSFDKMKTKLQCFYAANGECRQTYFMRHESTYRYAYISSIEADILEIPYSDGKTVMLTIMPNNKERDPYLQILSQDLVTVSVSTMLASLKEKQVTIHLPKFIIQNNLNLISTLQDLGVKSIFQSNASLTNIISNESLRVTSILQNVEIEVDEEGTLAAADTEIGIQLLSSWSNDFKMDRPFMFMIVDVATSTTLFSGRFVEPQQ